MSVADEAAALEAEVEQYPDERGEILLEAADAWRRSGRFDRAADLLTRLITDAGGDGCSAMAQLAEVRFEQGDVDEAYVLLDALAHDAAVDDGHCTLVAELLAERGDLHGALRWYEGVAEAQAAAGVAGRAAVRRPDPAPGWWIRGSVLAGACYG
ncbi:tetratricopeptide repeat protein [Verrucosispora sp. WMMD703]|uniref:tetratricopeptide repeat protein n=1 Tax=unclassified Micromonospora TaxID=2617518 RepID=UPI00249ADD39|nr:tetratricopeptide repeat protein [Verrucosispora sp. WMMD1129]WFE46991.1 tetratricopeptide repeat protein [Verrucosispora sp. WMMD1129]